ncbi:hypothetical protein Syun_005947 [Stephania yunnanensis]|uniref:Uncharacterized protein n=1 Tax=Stephania yunnanensis TaxID=152371 RepID=A0AAP0KVR0_9MAGN
MHDRAVLAIVAKLPVDLTTNMPSTQDQLSKLSGTTMTCVCIGFMAPSIASRKESESVSNMASLSIFVVTVAVNICIQLGTGVIFSFVAEHIIIICCMFMLLAILWFNTLGFNVEKAAFHESNVAHFLTIPKGEACFLHQAKKWYISRSVNNHQLLLCCEMFSSAIGPICIMCFLVLLQATYRSIVVRTLDFCGGVSDYKWSMWILVITQLAGATIGALAIFFRWLATIGHLDERLTFSIELEIEALKLQFSFMKRRTLRTSIMVLSQFAIKSVLIVFLIFVNAPIFAIAFIVSWMLEGIVGELGCCAHKAREDTASTLDSWRNEFGLQDRLSQRKISKQSKNKESRTMHGTLECGEPKSMNLAIIIFKSYQSLIANYVRCMIQIYNCSCAEVPIIGLNIAGASLVCLLLILWVVFSAIKRKARYIPCRRFSLNSVTLTLVAIAAKLPVDFTTNMPSARDQLSKLTCMAMTCICIGFMAPSIASSKESESVSNMASLSIFVVTVAVNICIQLGT